MIDFLKDSLEKTVDAIKVVASTVFSRENS